MSWKAIDRRTPVIPADAKPVLTEAVKAKIRSFLPRYETKRAVLLPALHIVQEALGHVSPQAMKEIAELLELPPSTVLDTITVSSNGDYRCYLNPAKLPRGNGFILSWTLSDETSQAWGRAAGMNQSLPTLIFY